MTDLLAQLQELYRDKLTALLRHQISAQHIGQYDANNTYQYVINREEVQLSWIASAVGELGGAVPDAVDPNRRVSGKGNDAARALFDEDARDAQAFVDKWQARIPSIAAANARHAKMVRLILGEVLEQKRFFEQALAGRTDLLGRRADVIGPAKGEVLPTRWIE
ncbi:MAG TPA: hypothetical protein VEU08_16650 [Vicinamibacterales bacterium]|nr:hypothetical protein [Vicinamibacterales bacterium]